MTEKKPKEMIQTDDEKRTTLNLSVSFADKRFLKIYAANQGMTVAAVVHECITEYLIPKMSDKEI